MTHRADQAVNTIPITTKLESIGVDNPVKEKMNNSKKAKAEQNSKVGRLARRFGMLN
jgi:hypothetical protein